MVRRQQAVDLDQDAVGLADGLVVEVLHDEMGDDGDESGDDVEDHDGHLSRRVALEQVRVAVHERQRRRAVHAMRSSATAACAVDPTKAGSPYAANTAITAPVCIRTYIMKSQRKVAAQYATDAPETS